MTESNPQPRGEVALFEAPDGQIRLDVRLERDTVWLTQAQMAELFGRERSVITKHIGNVFREGELDEESNVQNLHIAGSDKPVRFFNLDAIISVGYRVNSKRGTQFHIWATRTLRDHARRFATLRRQCFGSGRPVGRRKRPRAQRAADPPDPELAPGWWRMTAESDEAPNWYLKFKVRNCDLDAGEKGGRKL